MDVAAVEQAGLDPVMRGACLDEAERRGNAFVHHVAKLTGGLDLALARRGDAFDREQFAPDLGPGETGHRADLRLLLAHAVLELADTREVAEIVGRDRHAFDFLLEDLAQALTRQPRQFTFERADTRFARVVADQIAQTVLGELKFALFQPMLCNLLGQQVPLCDLDLFVLGIAFEPDDLHPVQQRLRKVETVRGGHEHDVAQIEIEFEVMILELVVLFGIEHLEQSGSRVAAEILAELVDLVEQEQRVDLARFLEVRHDLAR